MKKKLIIVTLLASTLVATSACGGTKTVSETGTTTAKTGASVTEASETKASVTEASELETSLQMAQKMFGDLFSDVSVSEGVTSAGRILYITATAESDPSNVAKLLSSFAYTAWFDYDFALFTQFLNGKPTASVMTEFDPEVKLSSMVWYDDNGNMIQNIGNETEAQTDAAAPSVPETKAETAQSEAPQPDLEQSNALSSAKHYLQFASFSRSGLIKQLEFEGFSNESATYAADNCGADWNDQAAKKAKVYLDTSSFSRSKLIGQLEFEGFTAEQAEYGATANGY